MKVKIKNIKMDDAQVPDNPNGRVEEEEAQEKKTTSSKGWCCLGSIEHKQAARVGNHICIWGKN